MAVVEGWLWRGAGLVLLYGFLATFAAAGARSDAAATGSGASPMALLQRMSAALSTLEYEGTLVYLHGQHLATLRIAHDVDGDVSRESLLALNGPIRAVTRSEQGVTCVMPDAHPILIERKGPAAGELLRPGVFDPVAINAHYLVHPLGSSRVAGRETDVVGVIPRDNLRYGYRFYIDRLTGLPLKTDLMNADAEPIEQVMFTEIAVEPDSARAFAAASAAPSLDRLPPPTAVSAPVLADSRWWFDEVPPGFALVMYEGPGNDALGDAAGHFLFSDGLASVSVYVEPGGQPGLSGTTHMGAIHAIGGRVADHQVTVVGEVPPQTVEAMLRGVRFVSR